tara:strand:+ start:432 stop:752 length:321 start_codon:yes stop_codon:yes gene_type:complete
MLLEASVSESAQAYHYVERAAEAIFGAPGVASSGVPRAQHPAWPVSRPPSSSTHNETVAVAMWYDDAARRYGDVTRCVCCLALATLRHPHPYLPFGFPWHLRCQHL